ncbi:MAG: hypothetical protein QW279_02190 [Candidatus Jordarchaeaceae archaeon]
MVELVMSLVPPSAFEQLSFAIIIIIDIFCAVYLFRRYLINRENLTLLFVSFFAALAICFIVNLLIDIGIIHINFTIALEYTFLIGATIVAVIGLVMIGAKQIYMLPPLVTVIAYIHQTLLDSSRNQIYIIIQSFSYIYSGQFLGDPLYITIKQIIPDFIPQGSQLAMILNLALDPLQLSRPMILPFYLSLIVFPTTILFYILAWKNRSGRSLGFSLGLTTNIAVGILTLASNSPRELSNFLLLVSALFFAFGIFGFFDKIMKRETKKSK